jgi:hypothetical protein
MKIHGKKVRIKKQEAAVTTSRWIQMNESSCNHIVPILPSTGIGWLVVLLLTSGFYYKVSGAFNFAIQGNGYAEGYTQLPQKIDEMHNYLQIKRK